MSAVPPVLHKTECPSAKDRRIQASACWYHWRFKESMRARRFLLRCKSVAPGQSAGGTWLQASSSCESVNDTTTVQNNSKTTAYELAMGKKSIKNTLKGEKLILADFIFCSAATTCTITL